MPAVRSSWIASIDRDEETGTVTVTYRDGRSTEITGMDDTAYQDWLLSPSPGSFFHRHVAGRYSEQRKP